MPASSAPPSIPAAACRTAPAVDARTGGWGPDPLLPRLQALTDENRLRILSLLGEGEACVCELQSALDLGQSLLSHHLKVLREAGLVRDRREGRWVHYSLDPDAVRDVARRLETLAAEATSSVQRGVPTRAGSSPNPRCS